jgi:hypothetical protein
MNKNAKHVIAVAVAVALAGGVAYYLLAAKPPQQAVEVEPAATQLPVQSAAAASSGPASAPLPAILFPVLAPAQPASAAAQTLLSLPVLVDADAVVSQQLTDLLGQKNILTFLHMDHFVRRVVATVDNLARSYAPQTMWPVNPTPKRFVTLIDGVGGPEVISPDNGQRYTPFVLLVESVDSAQAVAVYVRLYPLFQQAYEELGFPRRYFNDRLVFVLDHLLATPVQRGPTAVSLVEVKGLVPSLRPWVRYEFSDPALEALSAGQKMLLRTGPVNQRRLNAKLLEIRALVASAGLPAVQ